MPLREEESFFFEGVTTGRLPRLQWMTPMSIHMGQHEMDEEEEEEEEKSREEESGRGGKREREA